LGHPKFEVTCAAKLDVLGCSEAAAEKQRVETGVTDGFFSRKAEAAYGPQWDQRGILSQAEHDLVQRKLVVLAVKCEDQEQIWL
jgi:hypothetical protein